MERDYVEQFPLPMEWEYEDTNVYLIRSDSGNWLIDAGEIYEDNFEYLTEELADLGLGWADIEGVCVTHLHPDHAGLVFKMLDVNPDLELLIPPGPSFEKRTETRVHEWLTRIGMPRELHEFIVDEITDHKYVGFMKDVKETGTFVEPGTSLQLGDYECEVIEAHGHTPNQVVYYLPDDGLLFSGDHVLLNETPNVSLFPEYMDGNPLGDFHDGLETLLDRELSVVYPGHGRPFSNGQSRVRELLDHHAERLEHCRRAVQDEPLSAFEVAEQIPWTNKTFEDLDEIHQFLALGESMSHLIYLAERGEVTRERQEGVDYFRMTATPDK
jgi:glyoxylase-like metal-dependent hydrolase (beta-lactamase superfamily II)